MIAATFQFTPLAPAAFPPLRSWPALASTPAPGPSLTPASPQISPLTPSPPDAPETWPPPDQLLEAGDPSAAPEILLSRPTPAGVDEQQLLHAINFLPLDQLRAFEGFGPKIAAKTLEFRQRERFFTSLDELVRVPLIGPIRFHRLVGRESYYFTHPLHALLRKPFSQDIKVRDLQPLVWPLPGVPRIKLGSPTARDAERRIATLARSRLEERRVGRATLYVHIAAQKLDEKTADLLRALPRLLRQRLSPDEPTTNTHA